MKISVTSLLIQLLTGALIVLPVTTWAGEACTQTNHCRTAIRYIKGDGLGYNQGYVTLESFFSSNPEQVSVLPFLDLRGHVFDSGFIAANAGIGFRKIIGSRIYGFNTYYDFRDTQTIDYNQIGLGFESLGNVWDLRVNAYLPVGKKISPLENGRFVEFLGHNMIITRTYQVAMKGFNIELGFPVKIARRFNLYAALSPYYHSGQIGSGSWGGKARLKGEINHNITLEASNSYDPTFHNNFQLQLTLTLPLQKKLPQHQLAIHTTNQNSPDSSKYINTNDTGGDSTISRSRLVQPVERDEIIVLGNREKKSFAIDPETNDALYFIFVDNMSHSEGTFESPYPTLALAQDNSSVGNIIYVLPGDETTTGMDSGITLKEKQKLWGSGTTQQMQTTEGNVIIPAQTSSSPQITNPTLDGNGVTLSSNNQVSGLIINDVMGYGISGLNPGNIEISSTTISGSLNDQIHLEYESDSSGNITLDHLTLKDGDLNAIFINSTSSSSTTIIKNSTIKDNNRMFVEALFTGNSTFSFINNTVDSNDSASLSFNGASNLSITNNTISNGTSVSSTPLTISAGENSLSALIENNLINNNTCGAIHFLLSDTSLAKLTINHNAILNNDSGSVDSFGSAIYIDPNNTTSGNAQITLEDNIISGNARSAFYNFRGGFNDFKVIAKSNTIENNGGGALVFATSANTFELTATDNIISNHGDHGISTSSVMIDTATMTITNNQITDSLNASGGIVLSHEGSNLHLNISNNNISNNDGSGISIYSMSEIENIVANIDGNTINNNHNTGSNFATGIDIEQFGYLFATITNNTLTNTTGIGVYIGSTTSIPTACLTLQGNINNTDYVLYNDTGTFNIAPLDVDVTKIGDFITVESCPGAIPLPS